MAGIQRILQLISILSLDVIAGAVTCSVFAWHIIGVETPPLFPLMFGVAVWSVYTADHLIDSLKVKDQAVSARFLFHYRFRIPLLLTILVLSVVVTTWALLSFQMTEIYVSFILAVLVFLYFSVLFFEDHRPAFVIKEVVVGIIYTAGIWVFPMIRVEGAIPMWYFGLMISFFLLTVMVLLIYSLVDEDHDKADRQETLVTRWGAKNVRKMHLVIHLINDVILLVLLLMFPEVRPFSILLLSMHASATLFWLYAAKLQSLSWYKILGELIFIFPLLWMLVQNYW